VHEKDAANSHAFALGYPASLAVRIEVANEIGGDFFDEILEPVIPSIFFGVDLTMPPYHPLDVVVTMFAKSE
jgi:hypothetical protein